MTRSCRCYCSLTFALTFAFAWSLRVSFLETRAPHQQPGWVYMVCYSFPHEDQELALWCCPRPELYLAAAFSGADCFRGANPYLAHPDGLLSFAHLHLSRVDPRDSRLMPEELQVEFFPEITYVSWGGRSTTFHIFRRRAGASKKKKGGNDTSWSRATRNGEASMVLSPISEEYTHMHHGKSRPRTPETRPF